MTIADQEQTTANSQSSTPRSGVTSIGRQEEASKYSSPPLSECINFIGKKNIYMLEKMVQNKSIRKTKL